jgi:hypothetical protein
MNKNKISLKDYKIPYKRIKMNITKNSNNTTLNNTLKNSLYKKNDIKNDGKSKIIIEKISDLIRLRKEPNNEKISITNPHSIKRKKKSNKKYIF